MMNPEIETYCKNIRKQIADIQAVLKELGDEQLNQRLRHRDACPR